MLSSLGRLPLREARNDSKVDRGEFRSWKFEAKIARVSSSFSLPLLSTSRVTNGHSTDRISSTHCTERSSSRSDSTHPPLTSPLTFRMSSSTPPSPLTPTPPAGNCVVCGVKTQSRCGECAKHGTTEIYFCSEIHQKLESLFSLFLNSINSGLTSHVIAIDVVCAQTCLRTYE